MAGLSPPRRTMSLGSGSRRAAAAGMAGPKPGLARSVTLGSERTVKRLRLSKALTMLESTTVLEACRRMAARRVDAALLTDSNALLCGILTDKDIATRVIAREVRMDETPVWKVMTRHPVFVLSDTLAVEALQKMVQGKFRHLPVVENGEVMAMLDIAKCLYDAIARMERVSEKGKAVKELISCWVGSAGNPSSLLEAFKEQMLRPSLSTIITADSTVVIAAPGDSVLAATKMMVEAHANSAVVAVGNKPRGILTSRDILMRMIARNLPADSTPVEKVMTLDPECATVDTPILDALRTMQERKFLHLPVMDRDGSIVCIVDVLDITHAAISIVESSGTGDEATISMIQRFWDSAMALGSMDDETETQSLMSDATRSQMMSEVIHEAAEPPYPALFSFKLQDRRGRMHRFSCEVQSLTPLVTCILQRLGTDIDRHRLPQILYEDEDRDMVVLASDDDLTAAVDHARLSGWKGLKLFLDYSGGTPGRRSLASNNGTTTMDLANREAWSAAYGGVAAGAALVTGLGVMVYLRRAG
ncbi:CBS domain-containing protein CBSCBSPB5-like [Aegilops tauschii subsp. strangulata]|uniref:CBS domain-containing protein CBSCBSPB5-like n=1 Tax=Aegilops tauschii subsp. strangulata TaxID=200361 RepID=UPI001ABC8983|nr:CBS domain-containing protein CBSCBSPB5-like [Aegilops tauschii subsp. strangulata]